MTNGELIQKVFTCEVCEPIPEDDIIHVIFPDKKDSAIGFDRSWWNSEYKGTTGVDCISRKAVLDMAKSYNTDGWDMYTPLVVDVEDIEELPPVTPQEPRWISVKDRLPQKGEYGDVLVTFVPPAGTLWATVMIARYSDLMGIAPPCFHIGEVGKDSFENITPQVTAWMPLPEPYEPQKSEVDNGNDDSREK